MTTKDEALQRAMAALRCIHTGNLTPIAEKAWHTAIEALREALAQKDEQEPIGEAHAYDSATRYTHCIWDAYVVPVGTKLYTHPQPRQPHNLNCTVFVYRHRETGAIRALYTEDARAMTGRDDYEHVASLEPRMWIEHHFDDAAKERQPLTDAGINEIADSMPGGLAGFMKGWGWQQFARAIEAAHGIGADYEQR